MTVFSLGWTECGGKRDGSAVEVAISTKGRKRLRGKSQFLASWSQQRVEHEKKPLQEDDEPPVIFKVIGGKCRLNLIKWTCPECGEVKDDRKGDAEPPVGDRMAIHIREYHSELQKSWKLFDLSKYVPQSAIDTWGSFGPATAATADGRIRYQPHDATFDTRECDREAEAYWRCTWCRQAIVKAPAAKGKQRQLDKGSIKRAIIRHVR